MPYQFPRIIDQNKKQIFQLWVKAQKEDSLMKEDLMGRNDFKAQSQEFLNSFIKATKTEDFEDTNTPSFLPVINILNEISQTQAHAGLTPRETSVFILSLKKVIVKILQENVGDNLSTLINEILTVSDILDSLSIVTVESFIKGREEVIIRQSNEIYEISTPVIRVWDGILALPIIGTLDSERTQIVMENLLQEIVNTESSIAILDISGVPTVDTMVAQHLIKTVTATRLMGAECIISGIKPEIAQTIVHLGIDLTGVITKSSLAAALLVAFQKMNLIVTNKKS
jgi:rsbT co-antagonist protein RsbR